MDFNLERGTLVEDPKMFETRDGNVGANITLAEDHSYFDEDEEEWVHYHTSYWRLTAWDEMAEFLEDFYQGEHLTVEGKATDDNWEDDEGEMHYAKKYTIKDFDQWIPPSERED